MCRCTHLPTLLVSSRRPTPRKTAVLITGCSSGIGEAAALRLLKAGFLVFATVRKQQDADALKLKAGKSNMLHTLLLDVTKEEQIRAAVAAVKQRLAQEDRKLLGLVNNAGYAEMCPVELLPLDTLRTQYATNVYAPIAITRAFLPLLRSASSPTHSARLIFVSSIGGRIAFAGNAAYTSSKFAIEAIAAAFRLELARWNIAVSLLEPGAIGTRFNDTAGQSAESNWEAVKKGTKVDDGVVRSYEASKEKMVKALKTVPQEAVSICADAIEQQMLDSHPQSRMLAGWTSYLLYVLYWLPAELYDRLVGSMNA